MKKNLKAKNFRYLSKEYRKNPNRFLKEIVHQWGFNWSGNINYLINSCIYPPMRIADFEYGFMHKHLGQMVEVAYIIFTECNLKPSPKDGVFQYATTEVFIAEVEDDVIFPRKKLQNFFGFKTLAEWHAVLDDLQMSRDVTEMTMGSSFFGVECLAIREFLVTLPKVLQEIHDRGGLQYTLPDKVVA